MPRRKGDMVHGARTLAAVDLRRGGVIGIDAPALIAAHLPGLALAAREAERLAEQAWLRGGSLL